MNTIFKSGVLVLLATCFFPTQLVAAEEEIDRFYVKVDLGSSTFSGFEASGVTVDSESKVGNSLALTAGLQLSEFLSFELSHNQFGSSKGNINLAEPAGAASYKSEVSSNALSMIPSIPLGVKTRFFIELGEHVWESDVSVNGVKASSDGSDFFYGFGFSYDVRNNIRTGFDFSKYKLDSDEFKNLSVSLAYLL